MAAPGRSVLADTMSRDEFPPGLRDAQTIDFAIAFKAVIRCAADPEKADKRTRSKWSRLLRYADEHKLNSEPLDRFIKRKGGINKCVARFSRGRRRAG
jgi:hypothetical protein